MCGGGEGGSCKRKPEAAQMDDAAAYAQLFGGPQPLAVTWFYQLGAWHSAAARGAGLFKDAHWIADDQAHLIVPTIENLVTNYSLNTPIPQALVAAFLPNIR